MLSCFPEYAYVCYNYVLYLSICTYAGPHVCTNKAFLLNSLCSIWAGEKLITKIFQQCFLSVHFSCSYTRGNNAYLLSLTVLMEMHQRSWMIDRNWERDGGKQAWDTLLLYCLHSWLSLLLFLAVTVSPVTYLFPLLLEVKTKVEHSK